MFTSMLQRFKKQLWPNRSRAQQRDIELLFVFTTTACCLLVVYVAAVQGHRYAFLLNILLLVPVLFTANAFGVMAGLGLSFYLSVSLVPQIHWLLTTDHNPRGAFALISLTIFLHLLAYFVADIARTTRFQRDLSLIFHEGQELLSRQLSLERVIQMILAQAQGQFPTARAAFVYENHVTGQIEAAGLEDGKMQICSCGDDGEDTLAYWLCRHSGRLILRGTDPVVSPFVFEPQGDQAFGSMLAVPFFHENGAVLGWLVLFEQSEDRFTERDFETLDYIVKVCGSALLHADLYARSSQALARELERFKAVQQAIERINQAATPEAILSHSLDCALSLCRGKAGMISIWHSAGQNQTCSRGMEPRLVKQILARYENPKPDHDEGRGAAVSAITTPRSIEIPISNSGEIRGVLWLAAPDRKEEDFSAHHALSILAGHTATAFDKTRLLHQIAGEKERMSTIIRCLADGLITVDPQGRVTSLNPAAERFTRWTQEEAAGQHVCHVLGIDGEDGSEHTCLLPAGLEQQGLVKYDRVVMMDKLRSRRVIALSIAPLLEGRRIEGAVLLFQDISARDELERLQKELISSISHELRSPLTVIRSVAEELLAAPCSGAAGSDARESCELLIRQSDRLSTFLDRLLAAQRIESGKMALEMRPVPVNHFAADLADQLCKTRRDHPIRCYGPSTPLWVWADENALYSVLVNLMENACKYSPAGSEIRLEVAEKDGMVQISVADQGIGIPPEHQPYIFDRFYRIYGQDDQEVYGYGLGLYITRSLVEAMGGKIWVESQPGMGSRFTFTLSRLEVENG